jgi:hypothetical protein
MSAVFAEVRADNALVVTVADGHHELREQLLMLCLSAGGGVRVAAEQPEEEQADETPAPAKRGKARKPRKVPAPAPVEPSTRERILESLRAVAPCTARRMWSTFGLKNAPGPNHRSELHALIAEGLVSKDGKGRATSYNLVEA